ncbi:MAG: hypothetical protein A2176_09135 [Spirochaetes bacterium RBG_13_51_14]|nr:MAG: hypothetical protein A2176_09135 [Spirochaetes bacterium RBG_13_51_14]
MLKRSKYIDSVGPALLKTKEFPRHLLESDRTPLAEILIKNGFLIKNNDLTAQDYKLAKQRKEFLEKHKEEFEREGIGFIYENRIGDSVDFKI